METFAGRLERHRTDGLTALMVGCGVTKNSIGIISMLPQFAGEGLVNRREELHQVKEHWNVYKVLN